MKKIENRGILVLLTMALLISCIFMCENKVYGANDSTITVAATTKKSIKNLKLNVNTLDQGYTAKRIRPSVNIYDGNKKLTKDKDYTVSYSNNLNPGTAKITIKGKGNYTGTITEYFTIVKRSIEDLDIEVDTSIHTYTEEYRKPKVTIYTPYNENKKLGNKSFSVKYENNFYPGKATITIQGKGNYTGTVVKNFYIAPEKTRIKSVLYNYSETRATISWKRLEYADGYRIYMAEEEDGEYERVKTSEDNDIPEVTIKGLDPDINYYFKVIAYIEVDGERIAKRFSDPQNSTAKLTYISLTPSASGANRNHNLALACSKIDGMVLDPGDEFNWFKVIGAASAAKGYKKATMFVSETQNGEGYGGGVCQVSSTLYQAARDIGLKITERHQHVRPVTYASLGDEATVGYYGGLNFRFVNNKDYSIKIIMYTKSGGTTCCKFIRLAD